MDSENSPYDMPDTWEWWALGSVSLGILMVLTFAVAYAGLGVPSLYAHGLAIPALGFLTVPLMFVGLLRTFFRPPAVRRTRSIAFACLIVAGILGNKPIFPAPVSTGATPLTGTYRLPFDGEWVTLTGGEDLDHNIHATTSALRWSYDFTRVVDGKRFQLDGAKNEDFFVFGQPVVSPVSGEVVAVETGLSDNPPGQFDAALLGNHVVIKVTDTEFVFLGHLKQNSATVRVGEKVTAGQPIAAVGNSGRSIEPHLHIHAQNSQAFPFSEGLRLTFANAHVNGAAVPAAMPRGGEQWSPEGADRVSQNPVQ